MHLEIQPVAEEHYSFWMDLYRAYAEFYTVELDQKVLQTTWQWLLDASHPVEGLIAQTQQSVSGFIHYRSMPSPLRGQSIGFIDDLFVYPSFRNQGIAQKLILAVQSEARKRGWNIIRWITKQDNIQAQIVYDKLAKKTDWAVYEMLCD